MVTTGRINEDERFGHRLTLAKYDLLALEISSYFSFSSSEDASSPHHRPIQDVGSIVGICARPVVYWRRVHPLPTAGAKEIEDDVYQIACAVG